MVLYLRKQNKTKTWKPSSSDVRIVNCVTITRSEKVSVNSISIVSFKPIGMNGIMASWLKVKNFHRIFHRGNYDLWPFYLLFWYISTDEFNSDNFSLSSCRFELTKLNSSDIRVFTFGLSVAWNEKGGKWVRVVTKTSNGCSSSHKS